MTIREMSVDDLRTVLGWAAEEGWNPGREDAAAFHAADPEGFLLKEIDGDPVAAISVVNHDPEFAFLGLYLCRPEFRGRGHGIDVWRAGIAHAGSRSIGLDGVPDQQDNYARSGFVTYGSTVRYEGQVATGPDPRVRPATPTEIERLIVSDAQTSGMQRRAFSTAWFSQSRTRQTLVLGDGTDITAFATFRRCGVGTKVGPLCAPSEKDALALLASNPFSTAGDPLIADVQNGSALGGLLERRGFAPTFETARMFSGTAPNSDPQPFQAIATMELG